MSNSLPDIDKLEKVADFNRKRRTETARELLAAATSVRTLEEQLRGAVRTYETTYDTALTAWSESELRDAGFVTPPKYIKRGATRRRTARTDRPKPAAEPPPPDDSSQ